MNQEGALHNLKDKTEISTGGKLLNMENQVTDKASIDSLFERAGDYLETRIDLYKLKAVDKSSDIISTIVSKVIVLMAFLIFIMIINFGIAFLLGELIGRVYYGFFALAGFYLITGLIFYTMRNKWFKEPISNKIINKIFN